MMTVACAVTRGAASDEVLLIDEDSMNVLASRASCMNRRGALR